MAEELAAGDLLLPPRLEDAGLEDCALPPESIAEAFFRAAAAVSSGLSRLAVSHDDDEELWPRGCVEDAGPTCGAIPDALLGAPDESLPPSCGGGGGRDATAADATDEVVLVGIGDEESEKDRVLVVGEKEEEEEEEKKKACVEGIGDGVEELGHGDGGGDEEEGEGEDDGKKKPILVEELI